MTSHFYSSMAQVLYPPVLVAFWVHVVWTYNFQMIGNLTTLPWSSCCFSDLVGLELTTPKTLKRHSTSHAPRYKLNPSIISNSFWIFLQGLRHWDLNTQDFFLWVRDIDKDGERVRKWRVFQTVVLVSDPRYVHQIVCQYWFPLAVFPLGIVAQTHNLEKRQLHCH